MAQQHYRTPFKKALLQFITEAEKVRASAYPGRPGGLRQRGLDPEDRAPGPGHGHIENISASQVSEFNKELDAQVADFRSRPLEEEYPFLWIDALYQKVRVEGRVVSVAVM